MIWNSLAITVAIIIYSQTGVDHFGEDGFITILSVLQLLVISTLSYKIFRIRGVIRRYSLWRDPSAVWAIIALGFLFLATDDLFRIHERLDHLIHYIFNLQETGFTDRIDDILIGLYGLAGIGVLNAYRDELIIFREAFPFLIIGFVLLFAMVALDVLTNRNDILPVIFDHDQAVVLYRCFSLAETP